ncbi:MAG: ShlB/FhaC/HecB family hemolysin secretion/activation protein [Acetobacteraceae bacterium]|nr:ShlB/FhaC/HecB family hemolysin secretion/activation protein [Acetobacteraceae bacterium]
MTLGKQWSCRNEQRPSWNFVSALLPIALIATVTPALAQRPDAPFSGNAVPQGSPLPRILPPSPPIVAPETGLVRPAAPAPSPALNVPIRSVAIAGATAFPAAQLQGFTANLVGPGIPVARVEKARADLLSLYRTNGYVLTTVTAAIGPQGDLRFNVVEGRIAAVKLDGDIGPAGVQVLRFLNHLTEVQPIDNATIERWLLLAQDVPGVSLNAVLQPSVSDPGALTLVAQVRRQAFNGLLTADNRAFRQTGPVESLLVIDANSFTEFGERSEASLYHTDGNTQNFGQASTEFYVGGSGLKLRLYGGHGEAAPSDFLRTVGYRGITTVFGLGAAYPVVRSRNQSLNLVVRLDAIETDTRTDTGPQGQSRRTSNDDLRVARVGFEYAIQDSLAGDDRPAVNFLGLRGSQGLNFLGSSGNNNLTPGRLNERVDFIKVTAELSRTQTLFAVGTASSVALRASAQGQVSNSVLPPAEKFFLGGSEINRGFYAGQVTGDNALAWSLELQLNTAANFTVFDTPIPVSAQFYTFYDRGQTFENQSIDPNARLSSVGVGARVTVTRFTEFDVEGVVRNTRLPVGTAGIVHPLKADAAYWRVLTRF